MITLKEITTGICLTTALISFSATSYADPSIQYDSANIMVADAGNQVRPTPAQRREIRDRVEDRFDRREDRRDLREDVRDRREDIIDRRTFTGRADIREDIRDRAEDRFDRREDRRDRREDIRDRRN